MADDSQPLGHMHLARGDDGRLYVEAEDVTKLLRTYARVWTECAAQEAQWLGPEGNETELDPVTLRTLAEVMQSQADTIEVQFIAERTGNEAGRGSGGGREDGRGGDGGA